MQKPPTQTSPVSHWSSPVEHGRGPASGQPRFPTPRKTWLRDLLQGQLTLPSFSMAQAMNFWFTSLISIFVAQPSSPSSAANQPFALQSLAGLHACTTASTRASKLQGKSLELWQSWLSGRAEHGGRLGSLNAPSMVVSPPSSDVPGGGGATIDAGSS